MRRCELRCRGAGVGHACYEITRIRLSRAIVSSEARTLGRAARLERRRHLDEGVGVEAVEAGAERQL